MSDKNKPLLHPHPSQTTPWSDNSRVLILTNEQDIVLIDVVNDFDHVVENQPQNPCDSLLIGYELKMNIFKCVFMIFFY